MIFLSLCEGGGTFLDKCIEFKTKLSNNYIYDNVTGHIFFKVRNKIDIEKYRAVKKFIKASEKLNKVTVSDVKKYLIDNANGFKQLILEVTSKCNLRCKYCTYSENYDFTRNHGINSMSLDVAKKAVDYYFENFKIVVDRNPQRVPVISFYGGEPLLNFKLIKKIVEYIKITYPEYINKVKWHITTNGVLLNDSIQKFLYENKFHVLVSIDGYKENHDRNRLFMNGKPTFDIVYNNYHNFKNNYPGQAVFVSACYDYKTDMKKFSEFADKYDINILRAAAVSESAKYYKQFSANNKQNFINNFNIIKNEFFQKSINDEIKKDSFIYNFFGDIYGSFAYHRMVAEELPSIRPHTSTCVPGEKIYVESTGDFIVCEKVNNQKKIGNVFSGLNYKIISKMLSEYNDTMNNHCEKCKISRLCSLCFKDFCLEKGFKYDEKICNRQINFIKQLLIEYTELLEQNPKLFEEITTDYYTRLNRMGDMA